MTGIPLGIKPLGADAVALITAGGVLGEGGIVGKQAIRASWILVKDDGTWRLAIYQSCPRDPVS